MSLEFCQTLAELLMRGGSKVADADIAHLRTQHIGGVDGMDGNLVTDDGEVQGVGNAATYHAQLYLRAFRPAQPAHNLFFLHLDAGNGGIVDADDAVASQDAHPL